MNAKKSKKSNLERKRIVFFQLALVVTLSIVLAAFEWTGETGISSKPVTSGADKDTPEWDPIVTRYEKPEPQSQKIMITPTLIDDSEEPETEAEFQSTEVDPDEGLFKIELEKEEPAYNPATDNIYRVVEKMPVYIGSESYEEGMITARKEIAKNAVYSEMAREMGIEGTVWVGFVIDDKGEVTDINVVKGVDPILDKEAVKAVATLHRFKPGIQQGARVKVYFVIPIVFNLGKN